MRFVPFTALALFACGTQAPSPPPSTDNATTLGSSAEEIRKIGQQDSDDVGKCRAIAARCESGVDGGDASVCAPISAHCDALEAQLQAVRSDVQACLEKAAACEQSATDLTSCAGLRDACTPAGRDFEERRGQTLECADHAQQCLVPPRGFGLRGPRAEVSDAGANVCDANARDFIGCCNGHHGGKAGGDAGADDDNRRGEHPGFDVDFGFGFFHGNHGHADAGAPPPPPPARKHF